MNPYLATIRCGRMSSYSGPSTRRRRPLGGVVPSTTLPRPSHGWKRTRSVWASRLAFPEAELVQKPKRPSSSGTHHTGVDTPVPSRRNVSNDRYFSSMVAIGHTVRSPASSSAVAGSGRDNSERMGFPLRFGVAHDFRCPPGSAHTLQDVYAQTMEQIALLDRLGLDLVWFSEHHFVEDGYLPSFVPVAGAAAAVTSRMRISTNISIVPFSHPIRLAEDLAVLDQLSGGRIELGVGLGYAPHEFRAFGFPVSQRVSRTEECIDILRLAWSGERFSYHGKRWDFDDVRGDARTPCSRAARRCGWPCRAHRAWPAPCATGPTCCPRAPGRC